MTGHTKKIPGRLLRLQKLCQNQMTVIIVTVKKKTVIAIGPDLPRQKTDILWFDRQDLAAVIIVKSQNLGIQITHLLPDIGVSQFLIFFPVQLGKTSGILRAPGLRLLLFWILLRLFQGLRFLLESFLLHYRL